MRGDRALPGENALLQTPIVNRRAAVADHKAGGGELSVVVEHPGLQQLAGDFRVAVVVHGERVEVVKAMADWQVLAPPVLDPFKDHAAPGIDLGDPVGPVAQRWLETAAVGEVAGLPPVLGQNVQAGNVQRQHAVEVVLEVEANL